MYTVESHWNFCLEKCGGDQGIALLMMESAAVIKEGSWHGYWRQWIAGKKEQLLFRAA